MRKDVGEYILCSAILYNNGKEYVHQPINVDSGFVICGQRHHNCYMTAYILNADEKILGLEHIEGFLTSKNRFVDRIEGLDIAIKANQVNNNSLSNLHSEDLW